MSLDVLLPFNVLLVVSVIFAWLYRRWSIRQEQIRRAREALRGFSEDDYWWF